MKTVLIAAAAENEAIGRDGDLPWHLPDDLRRFKAVTLGHTVIFGSKTQRSIEARLGKPLPGRQTVIVSRGGYASNNRAVSVACTPSSAIRIASDLGCAAGNDAIYIAGGASIYEQLLPVVDQVLLTRVHVDIRADAYMPLGWLNGFALVGSESRDAQGQTPAYSFLEYRRA